MTPLNLQHAIVELDLVGDDAYILATSDELVPMRETHRGEYTLDNGNTVWLTTSRHMANEMWEKVRRLYPKVRLAVYSGLEWKHLRAQVLARINNPLYRKAA
jgi:hypothetical protein